MAWSDAARAAAAETRRRHSKKQKTPGIALSKAYRSSFTGSTPRPKPYKPIALTSTYSQTGKAGGLLKISKRK